jgi:hypothetical protein
MKDINRIRPGTTVMMTRISALAPKPGTRDGVIRICDPADLELLSTWPRHGGAVLDFPELDLQENRTWERRLQSATAACGCREATACLMIAILLYVLGFIFIGVPETLIGRVLGLPAAAVAGLAIGKSFALHRANVKARRLIRQLGATVDARRSLPGGSAVLQE